MSDSGRRPKADVVLTEAGGYSVIRIEFTTGQTILSKLALT